jgi:leucyl/phenylalanyl-tRNA---protein transferase
LYAWRAEVVKRASHPQTRAELTPELLIRAYAAGLFPMAESRDGPIAWYSPDPRGVIPLDRFKVSRSLRQADHKGRFEIRIDTAFREVMLHCADREETWISGDIIEAYCGLFRMGLAHSVETWQAGHIAGGLYGVTLGGAFFGESMFSLARDSSKMALWALVRRLNERGFVLLDTQFLTPHLASMGGCEIARQEYLKLLQKALEIHPLFADTPSNM